MDAFELLKQDHKKVSQLFSEIEAAKGQAKKGIFAQLKSELDLHAHVEEKFLYPALENNEKSRDITLESYEEHKVVKDLLVELASSSPGDEWDAKLTVLKENVEHHVEEEEGELFDKAEDVLSQEQIDRLGVEMEAEKAAQQGQPSANQEASTRSGAKAGAKAKTASKSAEKPGVLARIANFVGLGSDATPAKKSGKPAKKAAKKSKPRSAPKAASKSAPVRKAAGKKKAARSAPKSTKKTAAKSSKKVAAKKTAKAKQKAAKKSAPARKGGKKKAPARKR